MFIVNRDRCLVTDADITEAGGPCFDKKGDLWFPTYAEQKEADRKHDAQCLNRLRAITLTHASFEAFNKLLKEKKLRRQPKLQSVQAESKQDRERRAAELKMQRDAFKPTRDLMNAIMRVDRREKKKTQEKNKERETLRHTGESKQKLVSKPRTLTPKTRTHASHKESQSGKREKREIDETEQPKKRKRKREQSDNEGDE